MRRPDSAELEFCILMFLLVVPAGYFVVRWLLALAS